MSGGEWSLVAGALFAAGVVKGAIGFALPILTVPFLSIFIGPREAVVMMSVPVLLTNLVNVWMGWGEWRSLGQILPYMATGVAAVPAGVYFLYWGNPEVIRLILGLLVYVYLAARGFLPPMAALPSPARWGVGAGFGVAAGFLAGMSSVPGPVTIVYFSMFSWSKEVFIFLINAFNTVSAGALVSALAWRGSFTASVLLRIGAGLVPIFLGFWAGVRLRGRLDQALFYRLVRIALFLIATSLVARAGWQLFV